MVESLTLNPVEAILAAHWPEGKISLCTEAKRMLEHFANVHPADIAFLKSDDLVDRGSVGFAGVLEWDAFTHHVLTCMHCREPLR